MAEIACILCVHESLIDVQAFLGQVDLIT